uniref:WASH complex subunit 4 n=1 Tax=Phlebotomus papatasi TaxID=29031 RepID=A0A1B0D0L9_PHLPP
MDLHSPKEPKDKGRVVENICGEQQLRQFGKFLDSHNRLLKTLENEQHIMHNESHAFTKFRTTIDHGYHGKCEKVSLFQLVESDNKMLNKNIIVFTSLCDEIDYLNAEAESLQLNLLYYDEHAEYFKESASLITKKISTVLEFLFYVRQFFHRCNDVLELTIRQFSTLSDETRWIGNANKALYFQTVFEKICDLIVSIYIFDEIFYGSRLKQFWGPFKKQITTMCVNGDQFIEFSVLDLSGLQQMIAEMDELFQGKLVEISLQRCVRVKKDVSPKALGHFATHIQSHIKRTMSDVMKYPQDLSELSECKEIVRINAMCIFYHAFFGNLDHKIFKSLIELSNKFCGITLISNIVWCPEVFIGQHAATLLKGHEKFVNDASKIRQVFLMTKTSNLSKDVNTFTFRTLSWILQMTTEFKLFKNEPMQKLTLMNICKLLEFLITIHEMFQHCRGFIVENINSIIQHYNYQGIYLINEARKSLSCENYNERILDSLAALQITERCLYGPATKNRITIAKITLSVFECNALNCQEYIQKLFKILGRLSIILDLQEIVDRLCETSFLFWHQSLFCNYIKQYFEQRTDHQRILATLDGIDKCFHGIGKCQRLEFICQEQFFESVLKTLYGNVIGQLCGQIETSLRLDFHSNLQVEVINPFAKPSSLVSCNAWLGIGAFKLADRYVSFKRYVEAYLSYMFYNLTTISLHDWRTYGEMRRLAQLKMSLVTVYDHLPTQILEQGCDVLDIMRNIHVFVSQYVYNLNNQVFIERTSANKHLNTINIRHIANSLRTHGIGVVNTTVNFTYQFLKKKIYLMSQFLYDERIKSRLVKDQKWFRDNWEQLGQMYIYERADAFNKGIRKLGVTECGDSYLDTFRLLVSHIGNAMGYVRMMRSGCIHTCSMSSAFLPGAEERGSLTLGELVRSEGLSAATCSSATNLQSNIEHLWQQWSEGTEYFKLLVDTLAPFLRAAKNVHLKTFYLIVPPLTINFVEHMLSMKDRIGKKNRQDAVLFTDDGFVMGLAYILKILDQIDEFNSLHWFRAVKVKYMAEKDKIILQRKNMGHSDDVKLHQTLALTEKRIHIFQQEFELLYYNLSSAKIFFSSS